MIFYLKKCLYLSFKHLKTKYYFVNNKLLWYVFTNKTRLKDIDNNDDNYKKIIVKWGRTTDTDMVQLMFEHFKIGSYDEPYLDIPTYTGLSMNHFHNTFYHLNDLIIRNADIYSFIIENENDNNKYIVH